MESDKQPMTGTSKFYFRSGGLHKEVQTKLGAPHGRSRTWHRNGKLAEELHYRKGPLHGLCRFWNEEGVLLGTFKMVHGTGTQRYWHDNGQLRVEIASVDGQLHGRTRTWLRDGTLTGEEFYVSGVRVTRKSYLKAAKAHPDWPKYADEPVGVVARQSRALALREHELFVHSVLGNATTTEARDWLMEASPGASKKQARSLAKFRTPKSALRFIDALYSAGSIKVQVAGIHQGRTSGAFADWLLVELPRRKGERSNVRRICDEFARRNGAGFEPEKDIGETHLFGLLA